MSRVLLDRAPGVSTFQATLHKIRRWIKRLASRYPPDERITALREELGSAPANAATNSEIVISVQCVEDPFYFGLFSSLCLQLRAATGARCELTVMRSVSGAVGGEWTHWLARSSLFGSLISAQWIRAFRIVTDRVAFRSQSFAHPVGDLADWFRSRAIWRRLTTHLDLVALTIRGVPVGDLINDTYLRFRPATRVDLRDPFVARLIWQAHRDIRRARRYFRVRKPQLYLTSYSTYVEHGVTARVALQEGVSVRSFGNFVQFGRKLTLSDWFHTPDTSAYYSKFQALDGQDERLLEAERHLRARLAGGIDATTSYMRVSAYAPASEPVPDVAGAVVVFLHDFYDSPHVYDDLVFHDFWEWTCFTIETLQSTGRKFWLKPHPNQIALSSEVLEKLRASYPDVALLSPRITNVQLAEAGIACGVTVYGTVGHELAFLGVPTIASAKHPHHSFGFCRTARTAAEYRQYLQTPEELPLSRAEMRRQALAFYYMHNLHGGEAALVLRRRYAAFWKCCHSPDVPTATLLERLKELREAPEFRLQVMRMVDGPGRVNQRGGI